MRQLLSTAILCCLFATNGVAADPAKPTAEAVEFFEKKVRPVLVEHCTSCHGEKKQQSGLRLDNATDFLKGNDDGPVVIAGDPAKSKLIQSVRREGDYAMPPNKPLSAGAVAVLTEWVKIGAPFPATNTTNITPEAASRSHWAFQPVREPAIPVTKNSPDFANPIDRFVVAKLEGQGSTLAPIAEKRTLIRRAYFDLIGMPPTFDDITAFEQDSSPSAFEKVIDKLLTSPQYGERWGRYWLDIARYADTKGYVFQENRDYPFAYTYRDYVIRAFNDDKPYDRFILEQLAADKLPPGDDNRTLAAMGFLTVGRRFSNNIHDIIDDRIDVTTRGFMGLTVQCARCHDHKFDPIPIADYYSLYGIFSNSPEPKELPLIGKVARTKDSIAYEAELAKRQQAVTDFRTKRHAEILVELRGKESIAKYLLGVAQLAGKDRQAVQAAVRDQVLRPAAFARWQTYLTETAKKPSSVFDTWFALSKLPEKEFLTAIDKLIVELEDGTETSIDRYIMAALIESNPKSLKDLAALYGNVLANACERKGLRNILGVDGPLDVPFTEVDRLFDRADRDKQTALQKKLDAFTASSPFTPPRAMVVNDAPNLSDPVVFLRGNPNNPGPQTPRQFLQITTPTRKPVTNSSGRLEMANAIASPDNPLTARVMVNRVWMYHFGKPLVVTPSDFGLRSEPPSHPELLDWLAKRFVEDGWSVKKLHKRMMLSAAYRQSSQLRPEFAQADPENRLLSHINRRRLDFEALRDSMLQVSGKLDRTLYGRSVDLFAKPYSSRRTVYASIDRQNLPATFRSFDFASPDQHTPQRFQTTVPQQSLFMMNSPFVAEQAKAVVARPEVLWSMTTAERIKRIYHAILSRDPTPDEGKLAVEFLTLAQETKPSAGQLNPAELFAQVLLISNEFAFVD